MSDAYFMSNADGAVGHDWPNSWRLALIVCVNLEMQFHAMRELLFETDAASKSVGTDRH